MTVATYTLNVDWDNDGGFEDATSDLLPSFRITYGRDRLRRLSPPMVSGMSFILENGDNTYHPENTASPLFGNLVPHREVRLQATFSASTFTLFRGFLDDFEVATHPDEQRVYVEALDGLAATLETNISTALYKGIDTGAAINVVLDEVGWPVDDRDIDAGATSIPFWWEEGIPAWDAMLRLLNSEGPPALLYVDGGVITFRSRHHRLLDSASISSQATFRATGTEPLFSVDFQYDHGWRDIVNNVEFVVPLYEQQALSTVWEYIGETLVLAASEVRTIRATADDPFVVAVTADAFILDSVTNGVLDTNKLDSDDAIIDIVFTLTAGGVTTSIDRESGQTVSITFTAGGSGATLTDLHLDAQSVTNTGDVTVTDSDASSIADFGNRSWGEDTPWVNQNVAADLAAAIINDFKDPHPKIRMPVSANGHDDRMTQALTRKLSDRVTVIDAGIAGFDDEYFIDQITHNLDEAGNFHSTVFGCESVKPTLVSAALVFILDDVGDNGKLDTGVLAF